VEAPAAEAAPAAAPAPVEATPEAPVEAPAAPAATTEAAGVAAPAEPEAPKPVRKRAPRKPKAEAPAAPAAEPTFALEPIPAAAGETPAAETPAPVATEETPAKEPAPSTEFDQTAPADISAKGGLEIGENTISSDRATRLLVTAYIGIGNRLFIRGDGPGLSWDKGVPLQFVSIGKWRWESADATGPVRYKLYKNDAVECTALGEQQVDPGQQQEVAAAF
jgi:hypothetical protein